MAAESASPLNRSTVFKLASVIGLGDSAFIVGGQALNLWAERYAPQWQELDAFGPYTSKDLDYFGPRAAAQKLAAALDGKLLIPEPDDHTPNSALVRATIDGREIEIDFLSDVAGVRADALERGAVELVLPVRNAEGAQLIIPIMHPLHCLQSRIANVVRLKRRDDLALRQLAAAPIVVQAYIDEMLTEGDTDEAVATIRLLFEYLRSDIAARSIIDLPMKDPALILSAFSTDRRLDWRFRWFNLRAMRRKLAKRHHARTAGRPM